MTGLRTFLALSLGIAVVAQTPAPPPDLSPTNQPALQALSTAIRGLRGTSPASDEAKVQGRQASCGSPASAGLRPDR